MNFVLFIVERMGKALFALFCLFLVLDSDLELLLGYRDTGAAEATVDGMVVNDRTVES